MDKISAANWFAWITKHNEITINYNNLHLDSSALDQLQLRSQQGTIIPISSRTTENNKIRLELALDLTFPANYQITLLGENKFCYPSLVFMNKAFFSDKELGIDWSGPIPILRLWSPTATAIAVEFSNKSHTHSFHKKMAYTSEGIWELRLDWDFQSHPRYKLFVDAFGKTEEALDPYAKGMDSFSPGKGPLKTPYAYLINPLENKIAFRSSYQSINDTSFVGFELHVRDFSIDPQLSIPQEQKGTYLGLTHAIPYLKDLGITHVQIMPLQSFYTVDEMNRSFQGEDVPQNKINYNWGYDPHNYFTPEGWYSQNPADPALRLRELQEMIYKFHQSGIGVIVDVVYNHIFDQNIFETIAPGAYLRRNDLGEISYKSGAGATLESRNYMVRRLIIESLKYFKEQFGVDGFRFDLMGFIDTETMRSIRVALGPNTILYGEGWEFTDLPAQEATTKSNLPAGQLISVFNDISRDSYAGFMAGPGFIHGMSGEYPKVLTGIIGGLANYSVDYNNDGFDDVIISKDYYHRFAEAPLNTINYLSIHDGHTLWDKINLSTFGDLSYKTRLLKMSLAMLFTSQGRIILHGGDEFLRSKPLAANDAHADRAHTSENVIANDGIRYFHENSYNSPDTTNMIRWNLRKKNNSMVDYVKGLIRLRKKHPALRLETASTIQRALRFYNLAEDKTEVPSQLTDHSFSQLDKLSIDFIHGPAKKTLYLVGEVHGPEIENKNPRNNPYALTFDDDGSATIDFTPSDMAKFHLEAWSDPRNLQIKLVSTPGSWDYLPSAYSPMGNNTIKPENVINGRIMVDLAILDNVAGERPVALSKVIAYTISTEEERLLVVINAKDGPLRLNTEIYDCSNALLLFNEQGISNKKAAALSVPAKSTYIYLCPR
ncbi:MAG TPA: alpha-amylase family glycosyl hydrolase [Bacteriovoracaceae bacterium]|nr:alpha-amylase family glycosyl hydrolase [Bacteriovoracaceae bacterium]